MLIGNFWEVEHFTYYKPDPKLIGIKMNLHMQQLYEDVLTALNNYNKNFEKILVDSLK